MRARVLWGMVGVLLFGLAGAGWTTEMGGGAYHNGAEGFFAGAAPPPGNYFINYFQVYSAGAFKDKDGNTFIPNFDLMVIADVLRFVHVSNYKILGGNWAVHAFLPVLSMDAKMPGATDNRFGLGDMIVDPFILTWHSKNWHQVAGIDVYVPTGSYDQDKIANLGRNYWTFEPVYAFTFLSDKNFEISAKFMYDFNTKNEATDYASGNEFHVDYAVGQRFKNVVVGLGGYYYTQTTDDKLDGVKVGTDGFRGTVFAIGPQVRFDAGPRSLFLAYDFETGVRNRPEGQALWCKFVTPF